MRLRCRHACVILGTVIVLVVRHECLLRLRGLAHGLPGNLKLDLFLSIPSFVSYVVVREGGDMDALAGDVDLEPFAVLPARPRAGAACR